MRERIVVVGNGMAGFHLCELLAERKRRGQSIAVFGEERYPAYDRVHVTDYLARPHVQPFYLAPRRWYQERGIELFTGDPVVAIDRAARVVRSARGRELFYDRLVLATGSAPFVPPIGGTEGANVFRYRTLDDLEAIRIRCRNACRALVLGGGLLGLEAARALQDRGLSVTVLEAGAHLMPRQLDSGSAEVLQRQVEALGIRVLLHARTRRIGSRQRNVEVELCEGGALSSDFLVLAAGVRPRDELARSAGLRLGPRGGAVVDDGMTTSDQRVLAVGECASHRGVVYGRIGPCQEMARVAADRLAGRTARFASGDPSWRLKLDGVEAAAIGRADPALSRVTHAADTARTTLYFEGRKLAGACVIGPNSEIWRIGRAVERGSKPSDRQLSRFRRTGRLWPERGSLPIERWPASAPVCNCRRVCRGDLSRAVERGARTPAALSRATGAGTGCGTCRPLLSELCGELAASGPPPAGLRPLLRVSLIALVSAALIVLWPWELGWRITDDPKLTGFAVLGACGLGLALPLQKRLRLGASRLGGGRIFHGLVGLLAVGLLGLHTGMDVGDNFNRILAFAFLGVVGTGGLTGVIAALEGGTGAAAALARRYRRWIAWSHWLLLWLLPVLIGFHVATAYYF